MFSSGGSVGWWENIQKSWKMGGFGVECAEWNMHVVFFNVCLYIYCGDEGQEIEYRYKKKKGHCLAMGKQI